MNKNWFSENNIINYIIFQLNSKNYTLEKMSDDKKYDKIFDVLVESFVNRKDDKFKGSTYTDGNPLSYFIYTEDKNSFFVCLTKNYNGNEDIFLFYNDSPYFNTMKTTFIGYGNPNEEGTIWKNLFECLCKNRN